MKYRRFTIIASALTVAGCANIILEKPNEKPGDFEREFAECDYRSALAVASYELVDISLRRRELNLQCMRLKGWKQR